MLLRELQIPFTVVPGQARETDGAGLTGREAAMLNAHRKARAVAKTLPDALVLGADTVVCLGPLLYGKPASRQAAHEMIGELQGLTHEVVTGVCLIELRGHRERLFCEVSEVVFHPLDSARIAAYHAKIDPLDKAGGYAIQEHGHEVVAGTRGSYSNIVGLPMERLLEELRVGWPQLFRAEGPSGIAVP